MFGNTNSQQGQNSNTNKPLFGNGTVNSNLFENKTQNQSTQNAQQPANNLFGQGQNTINSNVNSQQLFGGAQQQQGNFNSSLFSNNTTNQNSTNQFNINSSLFGQQNQKTQQNVVQTQQTQNIFSQQTQPQNQSSFGLQNNTNTQFQLTQNQPLFGQNSQNPQQHTQGLFGQPMTQNPQQQNINQNNQQIQQTGGGIQNQINPTMIYSQTKILSLMPSNQLKYEKINYLQSKELKEIIKIVETNFENNRMYLTNFESIFQKIEENFKFLQTEAFKIAKYTKLMNNKSSKLKFILDNMNNDIRYQNDVLNKNRDNLKIIEHHPSMKINVPSDYLENMINEIQNFISNQIDQISDLETLFDLNYKKQYGNMHINSDLIEQIIVSCYENLSALTEQTSKIVEKVEMIKQRYYVFLSKNLGWQDYEIENKFRQNFNTIRNKEI